MTCPKCGKVHYFDSCPYCGFTASNQNPDDQTFEPNPNNYRPQENNYVQPYNGADNRNTAYQSPYIDNSYYDYNQPQENNQYYYNQPESKYRKMLDEYEYIEPIQQKKNNRRNNKNKKPTFIIVSIIGAMVVIYLIAWATGNLKVENDNTYTDIDSSQETLMSDSDSEQTESKAEESPSEPVTTSYTTELYSGHYTSGIDFPEGTYTITAISGSGNVSSDNMYSGGLNELMASEKDEHYISEFKNAQLPKGTVLSVSGVTIKISSDAANESTMEARKNSATEEITLTDGNFISGTDFVAGTYDIIAVSGSGNVSSDNLFDNGINAIMAPEADNLHETQYKNIELPEGVTLTVSGVEIKLVPSK